MYRSNRPRPLTVASTGVLLLGLLLLAYMVVAEGEPGALPLGLVLLGSLGCLAAWIRNRRR